MGCAPDGVATLKVREVHLKLRMKGLEHLGMK